jgi:hypothetical protein
MWPGLRPRGSQLASECPDAMERRWGHRPVSRQARMLPRQDDQCAQLGSSMSRWRSGPGPGTVASLQRHARHLEHGAQGWTGSPQPQQSWHSDFVSPACLQTQQVREFRHWGAWLFQASKSCVTPCFGRHRVNHRRWRTHLATAGPGIGRSFVPTRSDSA